MSTGPGEVDLHLRRVVATSNMSSWIALEGGPADSNVGGVLRLAGSDRRLRWASASFKVFPSKAEVIMVFVEFFL